MQIKKILKRIASIIGHIVGVAAVCIFLIFSVINRDKAIKEEIQAYKEELARDSNNTTLARFIRNLESRIYAELSRQLVDNMFGEAKSTSGSFTLEGNQVDYSTNGETVTLTINESDGGTTTISVPIGNFTF